MASARKTCPVSGRPAKDDVTLAVHGETIGFCSPRCVDSYKAAPHKYATAVYRQIYPQRVQVKCPVMGNDVDREVFIEHQGEKIYFCCKGCDTKFQKDPAKYKANLQKACSGQVHCPVTGQPIDPSYSLEGNDGNVYFCREECIEKYKTDPGRYESALLPTLGLLARGGSMKDDLVRCPVCPPDRVHKRGETRTIIHDRKTLALCNDECARQFQADPARYAKKLGEDTKSSAGHDAHAH